MSRFLRLLGGTICLLATGSCNVLIFDGHPEDLLGNVDPGVVGYLIGLGGLTLGLLSVYVGELTARVDDLIASKRFETRGPGNPPPSGNGEDRSDAEEHGSRVPLS